MRGDHGRGWGRGGPRFLRGGCRGFGGCGGRRGRAGWGKRWWVPRCASPWREGVSGRGLPVRGPRTPLPRSAGRWRCRIANAQTARGRGGAETARGGVAGEGRGYANIAPGSVEQEPRCDRGVRERPAKGGGGRGVGWGVPRVGGSREGAAMLRWRVPRPVQHGRGQSSPRPSQLPGGQWLGALPQAPIPTAGRAGGSSPLRPDPHRSRGAPQPPSSPRPPCGGPR